jgi:DNA-directed RNA polymerase subunit F
MGDLCFDEHDAVGATEWYLESVCKSEELKTDKLMEDLISCMDRSVALKVLLHICSNIPHAEESLIVVLQIAKIFIAMKENDYALNCYTNIKKIFPQDSIPAWLSKEFHNIYGDKEEGFYPWDDRMKLI